jgi:general secretion pathway protein L
MLRDLVLWWARQMRALLPRRLLPDAERGDALLIAGQAPHLLLTLRRRGRDVLLGRFGMTDESLAAANRALRRRPRQVILQVEAGTLLERPVELPLAAERDVDRVIGFEMDRLTPFAATDVVWQAVVTRRDQAQRQLLLRLSLVPRRAVQPCLDLLVRAGLTPTWLEGDTADGTRRRIMLAEHAAHRSHRPVVAAAGLVAVLVAAAVVTPFVMQWLAGDATQRAIAALGPRIARVEALRKHLADGSAGSDALAAERARVGNVLQVLATVTDLMPDDTFLTELSLHQGKLNVAGQSPAAARLIPALAAEPTLRNPAFAAPVTRAPDGHADLFVIRADLAP